MTGELTEPRALWVGLVGSNGTTIYRVQAIFGDERAELDVITGAPASTHFVRYRSELPAGWYLEDAPERLVSFRPPHEPTRQTSCHGCGASLEPEDLHIKTVSPAGRELVNICADCRAPEGLGRLDARLSEAAPKTCESCGRELTSEEEIDNTIRSTTPHYYCSDCKPIQ